MQQIKMPMFSFSWLHSHPTKCIVVLGLDVRSLVGRDVRSLVGSEEVGFLPVSS